jgi:hypothetical protein
MIINELITMRTLMLEDINNGASIINFDHAHCIWYKENKVLKICL